MPAAGVMKMIKNATSCVFTGKANALARGTHAETFQRNKNLDEFWHSSQVLCTF
jgi:hypothetical protein